MTMVRNALIQGNEGNALKVKPCWVLYQPELVVGSKVRVRGDAKQWHVLELYAGTTLEEVEGIPGVDIAVLI